MFSLMKLTLALRELKIHASLFPIGFDSLVNRARNAAVAYFLSNEDHTHLLFLDADIEFQVEDILKLIVADEPLIGAGYAQKWLNLEKIKKVFSSPNIPDNPMQLCTNHSIHANIDKITDKIEVDYLTTGCMLIRRDVLEKMCIKYPERRYANDIDGYFGANPDKFYNFFSVEINSVTKRYESEDYCFSRLWKEVEGKIYILPDITLTHYGWYGYGINIKQQVEYEQGKK
jgi:hypothetical protein